MRFIFWQNLIFWILFHCILATYYTSKCFQRFCAIFYTFEVKYVTFREPVLGLLSPDFVYVYMNRIETNYPVCRLYHYWVVQFHGSTNTKKSRAEVTTSTALEAMSNNRKCLTEAVNSKFYQYFGEKKAYLILLHGSLTQLIHFFGCWTPK